MEFKRCAHVRVQTLIQWRSLKKGATMGEGRFEDMHAKPMLTVGAQIEHLEARGVRFEECGKAEAARYLSEKNNYYKVASYRKLFDTRQGGERDGEYIDLDFAYLKDLAAIDQQLRYALLPMTLDIEHFAKVKLLNVISAREDEDGYSIVADYMASLPEGERERRERELDIMTRDPYCGNMVAKYRDDMPVWVFMEAISFGAFISLYKFCALRWNDAGMKDEHYLLRQSKSVRNAAAHSSNIVNGIAGKTSVVKNYKAVSDALIAVGVSKAQRKKKMGNAAIQQIVTVLYAHARLVRGDTSRLRASDALKTLAARMDRHAAYYAHNTTVSSSFDFLKKIFDSWF